MKLRNLLLTGLCGIILGATSCGGEVSKELTTEGVIVVGMECAYPPFNWTETQKSDTNVPIANISGAYAQGYDVQVARIIADELDLELKVKALSWGALINNLNSGLIDVIIAGMSPTEDRLESIDFTTSYYESTHVMLLKKTSKYASASTLEDFAGAEVIGQTNTIYAALVDQVVAKGGVAGNNLETVPLIVNAIIQDDVDATIVEEPVAKGIITQYPDLTYVKFSEGGFVVADKDRIVSIGVRKGFVLTDEINEILNNVITDEVRTTLMDAAIANAPASEE